MSEGVEEAGRGVKQQKEERVRSQNDVTLTVTVSKKWL